MRASTDASELEADGSSVGPATAEPVGVARRALAYLYDLLLVGGASVAVANLRGRSLPARLAAFATVATVAGSVYHVLLEGLFGRTVGKRVVGIAVIREDGGACSVRAAAVRTALRPVDWLPLGYALGMASIRVTERRQRVGDLIAETLVVRSD